MATRSPLDDIQLYDEVAGPSGKTLRELTYDDVEKMFAGELVRRELIDGELIVTPSPVPRHQRVVRKLVMRLGLYGEEQGGEVFPAPLDVYLTPRDVLQPDLVYLRAENTARIGDRYIEGAPDLVIEVSSPSTRRLDTVRKRALYERFGVAELWFVDLDAEEVIVHRLEQGRFGAPVTLGREDMLTSPQMPQLSVTVADLFAPQHSG